MHRHRTKYNAYFAKHQTEKDGQPNFFKCSKVESRKTRIDPLGQPQTESRTVYITDTLSATLENGHFVTIKNKARGKVQNVRSKDVESFNTRRGVYRKEYTFEIS